MYRDGKVILGSNGKEEICLLTSMANRHGLITGATGTGKTTTLKLLAESFSEAGVPVFFSDVKGDLAGMATQYPVTFWDIYGNQGIPLRTTVSEMGPILLSKLMELNDTQSDIMNVVFKIADDQGLLLIDTKDLKAMLNHVGENNKEYAADYGNIAKASVNTIIRNIVALESKGADNFFGEPALNLADWFANDISGKGMINILECKELINDGTLYSTFLLWMLSELFELLPEIGDPEKPRMIFFFDEAHLLFNNSKGALIEKLLQVIKLIRSKGVGVYFISQNPKDIPDEVLAQLNNKIQHGLRAYTPSEEKSVKAAANAFRPNPEWDTYDTILNLGKGEAIVSCLGADGIPMISEKIKINAPATMDVSITEEEKKKKILSSNLWLKYEKAVDRDSAYEHFQEEKEETHAAEAADQENAEGNEESKEETSKSRKLKKVSDEEYEEAAEEKSSKKKSSKSSALGKGVKQVAQTAAGTIGRQLGKSIGSSVGGSFGKTLGGNVGAQLARSILGTFFNK